MEIPNPMMCFIHYSFQGESARGSHLTFLTHSTTTCSTVTLTVMTWHNTLTICSIALDRFVSPQRERERERERSIMRKMTFFHKFGGSTVEGKTASQYEKDEGIFLRCAKFKDWIGEPDLSEEVFASLGFLACEYISTLTQLALSIQSSIRSVDPELKDIQVSLGTHQTKRNYVRHSPSSSVASLTIHTERPTHMRRSHTPLLSVHLLEAHRQLRPLSASRVQTSSCRSCW